MALAWLDLLIELGGFDLGENLAGSDTVADIGVGASLDVACGAGQDGGLGDSLNVAGQYKARGGRRSATRRASHSLQAALWGLVLRSGGQHHLALWRGQIAEVIAGDSKRGEQQKDSEAGPARGLFAPNWAACALPTDGAGIPFRRVTDLLWMGLRLKLVHCKSPWSNISFLKCSCSSRSSSFS